MDPQQSLSWSDYLPDSYIPMPDHDDFSSFLQFGMPLPNSNDQLPPDDQQSQLANAIQQQQQQQQQRQQQQQHQNSMNLQQPYVYGVPMIPPTPNSVEFHGGAATFRQNGDENYDIKNEQYARLNDEQVGFTINNNKQTLN